MTAAAIDVTETDLILLAAFLNDGFFDNQFPELEVELRPIAAAAAVKEETIPGCCCCCPTGPSPGFDEGNSNMPSS